MASKSVWGIDIGKYSIKAVRLDRKKGDILVAVTDIIPYRTTPLFDRDVRWEDLVAESLRDLYFRQRIGETPVVVSLTGHQIFNRVLEIAVTDPKRLGELVKHEAKQQIPGDIDEVIWKYQDISEADAIEKEVALFALRRDVVDGFMETLKRVNVAPIALTVAPLSVYNFVAFDRPQTKPLVVLDMGSDSTDLIVVEGRRVWIRPLRTAGNDFTQKLRDFAGKDLAEAEKLKRQIARHAQKDALMKALVPLFEDLVAEIQRSLGFYKQQADENVEFENILVMGGGTRVPNFNRELARGLQLEVEALTDVRKLRIDPKADANLINTNLPVLASAIGLALQGHEVSSYQINLLPSTYTRSIELESKKGWAIAAGIIVLVAGITQFSLLKTATKQMKVATDEATRLDKDINSRQGELDRASDYTAQHAERDHYLKIVKGHGDPIFVMTKIHELLPAENDSIPLEPGTDKLNRKVLEARRGLVNLTIVPDTRSVEIPAPVDPDADPKAPADPNAKPTILTIPCLKVSVSVWYHRPERDEIRPFTEFTRDLTAALNITAADFKNEECKAPAAMETPDIAAGQDKGKYMVFTQTFYWNEPVVAPVTKEEQP